jgi:hypothetical protein
MSFYKVMVDDNFHYMDDSRPPVTPANSVER